MSAEHASEKAALPRTQARRAHRRQAAVACAVALTQLTTALGLSVAPLLAAAAPARQQNQPANITLNFVNAEIEGVARAISAILNRQIVVDPRVKGTITLYSDQPLTAREAYLNFLAALRGQGFAMVEVSGMLKIVPEAEAKLQTDTVQVGTPQVRGDQILTQIFRLQHESAISLVTVLRPLISPNNTINANPSNNTLVITDYADNLQRIGKIIAAMDVPSGTDLDVIPLQHALALDVAPIIQKMSEAGGGAAVPGAPAGGGSRGLIVMADARTNSLLVRAPNAAQLTALKSLVAKLDRPSEAGTGGSGIYVVYLKNADAAKLATILRASFSPDARSGSGSGGGGGSTTSTTTTTATPAATTTSTTSSNSSGASPQSTAPVQASAGPSTGGFIQADPATNSLIITASEPLYRQLRAVIDQLDGRRAQIFVESMIVEISADKVADIGVQWQGLLGKDGDKNGVALGTNYGVVGNIATITRGQFSGDASAAAVVGQGLNIGLIHNFGGTYALGALANFLQTNTDANILSTPNLVALDNEEAKIVVGQNVPFVTGSYTNNNSSNGSVNPFTTVERKDVGITLRVKPQIGEDGTVRMTIYQENSAVVGLTSANQNGPTTNKSSIETIVVVNTGQVIVLGGLIKDNVEENESKVPVLGDVPYLGGLFRSRSRTHTKQNLMVFLRPVVLRNQADSDAVSLDRYDQIRAVQKDVLPKPDWFMPSGGAVLPPLRPADSLRISPAPAPAPASTPAVPGSVQSAPVAPPAQPQPQTLVTPAP